MSKNLPKLQWALEQVTTVGIASENDLGSEAQSLREAWLDLGRLLEAAQPKQTVSPFLHADETTYYAPILETGEELKSLSVPRSARAHRWLLSSAALMAASLLIGILTTWNFWEADPSERVSPVATQTAAIKTSEPTLISQEHLTASASDDPQWDDSLDEQIAQVGWQMLYARQDVYATTGVGSVQYGIEQMQKDLDEGNF
jgi:hypothetical protein